MKLLSLTLENDVLSIFGVCVCSCAYGVAISFPVSHLIHSQSDPRKHTEAYIN